MAFNSDRQRRAAFAKMKSGKPVAVEPQGILFTNKAGEKVLLGTGSFKTVAEANRFIKNEKAHFRRLKLKDPVVVV